MRVSLILAKVTLCAVALAQAFDVVSTNVALANPANHEANPVMALAMATLGSYWWILKAGIAGTFLISAYRMTEINNRALVLLGMIAKIYLVVIISNFMM